MARRLILSVFPLSVVPWGVAKFRGGPFGPLAFLLAPIPRPPTNTRRFETAEMRYIGPMEEERGNVRIERAETAKKMDLWA